MFILVYLAGVLVTWLVLVASAGASYAGRTDVEQAKAVIEQALRKINSEFDYSYHREKLHWDRLGEGSGWNRLEWFAAFGAGLIWVLFWPGRFAFRVGFRRGVSRRNLQQSLDEANAEIERIRKTEGWATNPK
jgi:hypothetical protein